MATPARQPDVATMTVPRLQAGRRLGRLDASQQHGSATAEPASDNTLGLRCARFARWPPQAGERGSWGKASDTASPGWRRAPAAS